MDAPDHRKAHSSGNESHGALVCNKCGWQYPNPHPSAKHRRAHKKICGTIDGHKLVDSEKTKPGPDLNDEHLSDDEHKTPSEKTIGGTGAISSRSEEEVFADAVCEFSHSGSSPSSDLSKGNKDPETIDLESVTKTAGTCSDEIQLRKVSSTTCEIRNANVSDSRKVSPAEALEIQDLVTSSMVTAITNQKDDKNSAESRSLSVESETLIDSSQDARITDASDTAKYVGVEREQNEDQRVTPERNLPGDFVFELGSTIGNREDIADTIWNDEVVYSEVEGPDVFVEEKSEIFQSTGDENVSVDPSTEKTNAAQDIGTGDSVVSTEHGRGITADKDDVPSFSARHDTPPAENSKVSLHELKEHMELKLHQSANPSLYEANNEEERKTKSTDYEESMGIVQSGQLCIGAKASSSDMLALEGKNEHQGQNDLADVEEFPIQPKVEACKIENTVGKQPEESMIPENIEIKTDKFEASESLFGASQSTVVSNLRTAVAQQDHVIVDKDVKVNRAADVVSIVDRSGYGKDLFQANVVAEEDKGETINEGNNAESKIISEPTGITECHVALVLNVPKGGYDNDHLKGSTETYSSPNKYTEICENNDEARPGSSGGLGKINTLTETTNIQEDELSHSGSTVIASDTLKTDDQKLQESGRTGLDEISGVSGVTEGNETDNNGGAQSECIEPPTAVDSDHDRDLWQLQNPSEAHILPLVSSSMTTGDISLASDGACEHKSQPLQTGENASFIECQNNNSGGDVLVHSSERSDGLEANQGSAAVLSMQLDTPLAVDAGLKNTCTKPSGDAPSQINAEKSSGNELRDDKYSRTGGVNNETAPQENPSQPSLVAQTTSEEIIEKITNRNDENTAKQQHVPLKHLLSEARSPRQKANDNNDNGSSVMPRVRSILGPETSGDSGSSMKGEASEEQKTPVGYPVDTKREERKVKGRPFWVPFVCCSSAH